MTGDDGLDEEDEGVNGVAEAVEDEDCGGYVLGWVSWRGYGMGGMERGTLPLVICKTDFIYATVSFVLCMVGSGKKTYSVVDEMHFRIEYGVCMLKGQDIAFGQTTCFRDCRVFDILLLVQFLLVRWRGICHVVCA